MICLPLPRSSAGVPRKTISPGSSSATAASAIAAPTPGRGHRVVAAAVAEPGQRVVLGEDPDPRPGARRVRRARIARIAVGRLPAGCSTVEPVPGERLGDPGRGVVLLEGRLRVGVDPVRQVEDLVARGLDGGGEPAPSASANGSAGLVAGQRWTRGPPGCDRLARWLLQR